MTSSQGSTQRFPRKGDRAGTDDDGQHQAVLQRRAIAAGAVIVFLILVVLLAKGCESAAKKRGIKDFINQTNSIVTQSNQSSRDFFGLLRTPGEAGATEIDTSINEQRSLAAELVRQANNLSTPGDLSAARRYLVETLEFRRDGLTQISAVIGQALGDQNPDAATQQIAADMQNFLTSDVIYSQRAYAYMNEAVKKNGIAGSTIPASRFLPSLDWLDPATVSDVLSRARGGTGSGKPVAPGTHGTGITGVTALPSGTALATGGGNSLAGAKSIEIDVQNQGVNPETGVVVTLQIAGGGTTISLQDTIAKIAPNETQKVTIPLTRTPSAGSSATLKVEVRRVPGEQNIGNNRQSFSVTF